MKQFIEPQSRRQFIVHTSQVAAGFSIGFQLAACKTSAKAKARAEVRSFKANAWLTLRPDGSYEFILDKVEMGQGAMTGLATIVAEALNTPPESLHIRFAPADRVYNNLDLGLQITGGSTSVKSSYKQLTRAGAMMKHAILLAAAKTSNKPIASLSLKESKVFDKSGNVVAEIGTLLPHMTDQGLEDIKIPRPSGDQTYIGHFDRRLDARAKVTGTARFGIDVDMINSNKPQIAVILRNPVLTGGSPQQVNTSALEKHPAVTKAMVFDFGVVLLGENFGRLKTALNELAPSVKWNAPKKKWDSQAIDKKMSQLKKSNDTTEITVKGDLKKAAASCEKTLESEYNAPYLAHAPMEPMNATAYFNAGRCKLILPTQNPGLVRAVVAANLGLDEQDVDVEVTFLGGGFGRRLEADYAIEAALIAKKIGGAVKVMWTREQDMVSGPYRPVSKHFLSAGVKNGKPIFWTHQLISPSIMRQRAGHWIAGVMPAWSPRWLTSGAGSLATKLIKFTGKDTTSYEGADNIPYAIPNVKISYNDPSVDVPICFFRSVGHSYTGFVVESFVDELAHLAGEDPYKFRKQYMQNQPRLLAVLDKAASAANWHQPLPEGVYRGIAAHESFQSFVGMVAQVRKLEDNAVRVEKVFAAVDCGIVVNPDIVRMQIESGVIFGLSMAFHSQITMKEGMVEQTNFHQYEVLRMADHPEIEVHIIESSEKPTGVGEPGVPPLAAAVGNALFAATGNRQRQMPFIL